MTNPKPEVCVCAAVKADDGEVVRGKRHCDCIKTIIKGLDKCPLSSSDAQGFVTSLGRFVTREEGRRLQDAAGIPSKAAGGYRRDTLFSEDLY